jgi:luciferase family oxidoreductase group 1
MIADLQALLNDTDPPTPGMENARAFPRTEVPPEMWMLGSSDDSATLAGLAGLPYNFAYFINPNISPDIFDLYRTRFKPGPNLDRPHTCLSLFAVCADTEEEAKRLARSRDLWYIRLLRGNPGPFPTPEEALGYPYSASELALIHSNQNKRAVGTPAQVRAKLESLAAEFGVEEVMLVTIVHDHRARLRSYELLANEFELAPAEEKAA